MPEIDNPIAFGPVSGGADHAKINPITSQSIISPKTALQMITPDSSNNTISVEGQACKTGATRGYLKEVFPNETTPTAG